MHLPPLIPERRFVLACAVTCLVAWPALVPWAALAGPRDLPARNLLVEWRIGGQGSSQLRQGGIQTGRVIIDSRRGVIGQAGVAGGFLQQRHHGRHH